MGWKTIVCLVFFTTASVGATRRSPVTYDLSPLLTDPTPAIRLIDGKSLVLRERFRAGTKVLFEDKMPGANWGHPAVFRVVDNAGNILEEVNTQVPPRGLEGILDPPPPVTFAIQDLGGVRRVNDPSRFYAFLLNGQADPRHWNDSSFLYRVLTRVYGYSRDHIIVSDSISKASQPDLDADGNADIHYGSDTAAVEKAIQDLAQKMRPGDQLIVAVNDHGVVENGESQILLYDKQMSARTFVGLLGRLPTRRILHLYGQCFSGGFVRPSVSAESVAMSAATNQEFSWGMEKLEFDEFMYHVISAFAGQTHDGKILKTDLNRDGRVSAKEAFAFAVARDRTEESPLLETSPNSLLAQNIGFGF